MKHVTFNATKTILASIIKRHFFVLNVLVALIASNHCITICTNQLIRHVDANYVIETSPNNLQVQLGDIKTSVQTLMTADSKTVPFIYLASLLIKFLIQILAITIAVQVALCSIHGRKYLRFTPTEFIKSVILYTLASLTALVPVPFFLASVSPVFRIVGGIAYIAFGFVVWRCTVAALSLILDQKKSIIESIQGSFKLTSYHYFHDAAIFVLFMVFVLLPASSLIGLGMAQHNIYIFNVAKLYLLPLATVYMSLLNVSFYAQLSNQNVHF